MAVTKIQGCIHELAESRFVLFALGKPSAERAAMLDRLAHEHGLYRTFAACICRHKHLFNTETLPSRIMVSHTNIPEIAGAEEIGEAADYLASLGYTILACTQRGKPVSIDDAIAVYKQNGNPYYQVK
jgi:hypothetical protein